MPQKATKIHRVELSTYDEPLHCPFCGKKVMTGDLTGQRAPKPCKHTLFIAHDEGFEYRSKWFDGHKKITGVDDEDVDLGEANFDEFTDDVTVENGVKFAVYVPAPSFAGFYCGFAANLK